MIRPNQRWAELRLWTQFNEGLIGFLAVTALTLCFILFAFLVTLPKDGQQDVEINDVVTGLVLNGGRGTHRYAIVTIDKAGHTATVGLPYFTDCRVGSRIAVSRRRAAWGSFYVAGHGSGCNP